jgi:hypothetical protein
MTEERRMRKTLSLTIALCAALGLSLAEAADSPSSESASPKLNWYRGNTHTHTVNSDGNTSPDTVARWYKEHDYQFLFITDHEYLTDPAPLNQMLAASERFLLLPGQEITQWGEDPKRSAAHVNGLFTKSVIWPVGTRRCIGTGCGAHAPSSMPLAETFKANIMAVKAQGAIPQVNHPNYRWSVKPEDLYDIPDGTLLEVWNGLDSINNLGGATDKGDSRPSSEGYWDILLSRGKIIYGVGSDDAHDFSATASSGGEGGGRAWIVARAPELTSQAIESALRKGEFYASTGVSLTDIVVEKSALTIKISPARNPDLGPRYLTRFVGTDGKVLAEVTGLNPTYAIKGNEGYVRASITDSNGKRAWTQPVFTDERRNRR